MIKIRLFIFAFAIALGLQAQNNVWIPTDADRLMDLPKVENDFDAGKSFYYTLNWNVFQNLLAQAPNRQPGVNSSLIVPFPLNNGTIQNFKIYKASILHPDLRAALPDVESYVGFGIEDKTAMIRFSTTLFGFHGMIMSARSGNTIINPYTKGLQHYTVFNKKNATTDRDFECLVQDDNDVEDETPVFFSPRLNQEIESTQGILRTYRLAMACTIEYAAFHINAAGAQTASLDQRKIVVMNAMIVTMTRVNGIYEKDMSLTMEFVHNNMDVIFIESDDFNNNSASQLINQSQTVINQVIGFSNYDIGHTVSTGGGGLAQLNSPCTNNKARGITGLGSPVGDPFDVDYVAHEIGHQFGARHTFNNSCNNNRSSATAVEPGSGSTIMAYAGICAPNVQNNSDEYFHAISLNEMINFTSGIGNCSFNQSNGNTPPVISAIPNRTVPISTPLVLRGNATDTDNDPLTYTWEQTNNNIATQPPLSTNAGGPAFRSLSPSTSPDRFLPNFQTVLNGSTQNTWEVIPSIARTMSFALTVRDNGQPFGGQTARANTTITFTDLAGPFVVTSQNDSSTAWFAGESQEVTWDVANTTGAGVNTQFVNILLSTDGGQNFSTVLASNTPNDGSEMITVPNVVAANCRILIEAVGNIFYNVNTTPFTIGIVNTCVTFSQNTTLPIPDGAGSNQPGTTAISELNVTDDLTILDIQVSMSVTHTWIGDLVLVLEHPDGTQVPLWNRNCNNPQRSGILATFRDNSGSIICASPTVGTFSPNQPLSALLNKSSIGVWKLRATDFFVGDLGQVNQWSIDFNCTVLSNNSIVQPAFMVYPNPNKGKFTISGTHVVSDDIQVQLFDMSGRRVYNKSIEWNTAQQADIVMANASPGMYIVYITDGDRSFQHKVIVE
jgi:subtilisin-like proprotein convertase family protein